MDGKSDSGWRAELRGTLESSFPDLKKNKSIFPPDFLNSITWFVNHLESRIRPFSKLEIAGTIMYFQGFRNEIIERYPSEKLLPGARDYPVLSSALGGLEKANSILVRALQRKY